MLEGNIGHYQILTKIASGGAGDLYTALDTRLNRTVVIKTVQERFLHDPTAVRRFQREAQIAASLDHPYICQVHELLEHEDQLLVIMEYVEGTTLAETLKGGPIGLTESVRIAYELAEALKVAHESGLIHRDIKPSNIMITTHGHVKVMDFGIAKVQESTGGADTTITTAGVVIGTPRYMSPEQAVGDTVDQRSDVYSYGIVVYQCLSGQLPFEGETNQTYLENLITRPPGPLPTDIPEELSELVLKCLSRDREMRFESGGELLEELRGIIDTHTTLREKIHPLRPTELLGAGPRRWIALSIIAGGLIGFGFWIFLGSTPGRPSRIEVYPLEILIREAGEILDEQVTPDNNWISYLEESNGERHLWKQPVAGGERERIPLELTDIRTHLWSPDCTEIACLTESETGYSIHLFPADGGQVESTTFLGDSPRFMPKLIRWTGSHIYLRFRDTLWRFDTGTDEFREITGEKPNFQIRGLDVRPDEQKIVYGAYYINGYEDLWLADLDGSNPRRLTNDPDTQKFPRWLGEEGDRIIYLSDEGGQTDVWQMSLEDGSIGPLATSWEVETDFSPSPDGSLILATLYREKAELWRCDPAGGLFRPLTDAALLDYLTSLSQASDTIAFQRSEPEATYATLHSHIMVAEVRGDNLLKPRLVADDGFWPMLSPDGRWLAFSKVSGESPGVSELWVVDLSNDERRLVTDRFTMISYHTVPFDVVYTTLVWDRQRSDLYYVTTNEDFTDHLYTIQSYTPTARPEQLDTHSENRAKIRDLSISQDGRMLAYIYESSNRDICEFRLIDLESRTTKLIGSEPGTEEFYLKGWMDEGGPLLALRGRFEASTGTNHIEVFTLDLDGTRSPLHTIPLGWEGNVTFDRRSGTLCYTFAREQIQNLAVYDLGTGVRKVLTDNADRYTSFSGIQIAADGSIIYSLQEWGSDIGVIRRNR